MFPAVKKPDFILSLGTGEPKHEEDTTSRTRGILRLFTDGAFPRYLRLGWEKMRDRKSRQAYQNDSRYHRLDIKYDAEPWLDDTSSIPILKNRVDMDPLLPGIISDVARHMIASLFYFELDPYLDRLNGEWNCSGHILCSIRRNNPAFTALIQKLTDMSATFWLDDDPISGMFDSGCFYGRDGNFRKRVEVKTKSEFSISLKQGRAETTDISGSPFTIEGLAKSQGLDAVFGRADHRKRAASDQISRPKKRQRRHTISK